MNRLFNTLSIGLLTISYLLSPISSLAAEPFPPFSVEGNPDDAYQFEYIFPLFTYIKPSLFQVFENRDYSRDYQHLAFCPGGDRRDYECSVIDGVEVDSCDGGDVDLCHVLAGAPTSYAYTAHSGSGNCKIGRVVKELAGPGEEVVGKCEYTQIPKVYSDIKGTDFSRENRSGTNSTTSDPASENTSPTPPDPNNPFSGLIFPKLQNEALRYGNFGSPDNPITYGSHLLSLNQCERTIRQLLVVTRAKQTKATLAETGEWPLGWVDWGYETQNGKTLLQIQSQLPAGISGHGFVIAESVDDFFLNAGNLEIVTDVSASKQLVCDQFATGLKNKDIWATDLAQVPLYSPSFRQGFVRGSICIWDLCCPGLRCPLDRDLGELEGASRNLYYDISISQAFGAALDDLLLHYPLETASKIFADIAGANQLVRFATSASTQAIPSVIRERLDDEIKDPCFEYRPNPFVWGVFGLMFDYLDDNQFLDEDEKCPGYRLQPSGLSKEKGGAFPESLLSKIINLIWRGATGRASGNKVDEVEPVKYHLITVPDAMGQSISAIEKHVYNTYDTLAYLDEQKEYNENLSNIVDDNADYLYAGKYQPVASSKRFNGLYPCGFSEYSTHETSIEAYALGARDGCDAGKTTNSTCDGQAFGELLASSPYGELTEKAQNAYQGYANFLTPELMKVYAEASEETGVPCEILAGIHKVEADLNPNGSLVSGRQLGTPEPDAGGKVFRTLLETAVYAGEHLKGKVGGNLNNLETITTALSRYNGGGNSNCQPGYPWPIPYAGCPRAFEGEDDPYPTNWIDNKHNTMYLLYCADHTACEPQVWERPGALTFAIAVYENMTKDGQVAEEVQDTPLYENPTNEFTGTPATPFAPTTCGPEELSTALGCLPVSEGLATILASFAVGISGAISLVVMLMGTISTMTAAGDPEKLKRGKELFTGAIVGLLFIIFSVVLLRTIAGDIIKLPGF